MERLGRHSGALVLLCASSVLSTAAATGESTGKVLDVLNATNETFRRDYDRARREITGKLSPLIYCNGEVLILITGSSRKTESMVPTIYTLLKSVDHIAVAAYIILANHSDQVLEPEVFQNLEELRDKAVEARSTMASADMDEPLRERQYRIIDATIEFISQVQKQGFVSSAKLRQFASGLSETLMRNGADAVAAQLSLINQIVTGWKNEMSADEWKRLRVILTAGHMPRERLVTWQYFSGLLNQKREGERIVIMEGLDDVDKGIELLGTHMLDEKIAVDFFGDRRRMHKDLLSNGARLYLRRHRPGM